MSEWNKIKRKGLGEVPQTPSENIQAPETAPSDKRASGRTEQMNLKVSREFKKRLKMRAAQEGCLMVEVLEKSFEIYSAKQVYEREKEK